MAGELLYVDSSALLKLVVAEPESEAFAAALTNWPIQLSSVVTLVEVPRAARRASDRPEVAERAERLADRLGLIDLTAAIAKAAARLQPATLRSLDAIHLASAASLGNDLGALATYNGRLMRAAASAGMEVLAPG